MMKSGLNALSFNQFDQIKQARNNFIKQHEDCYISHSLPMSGKKHSEFLSALHYISRLKWEHNKGL